MSFTTLITTADLAPHLDDPAWVVIDCRFDLARPDWGEAAYRAEHLPGAAYAHLDRDLSGAKNGRNGRHPLPEIDALRERFGRWGIGPDTQVAAYDQGSGMWASRLWWLLRYLGHTAVAVLEGGFARWSAEGRPTRANVEARPAALFSGAAHPEMTVTAEAVEGLRADPAWRLIDVRAPERYRGEVEPIDPVAGHIPGAVNLFNLSNVQSDGTFLAPEALRARFLKLLGDTPPEQAVAYCGSGVAAAHTVLALEIAGLPGARLYPGSWSEWCSDRARAVARGEA